MFDRQHPAKNIGPRNLGRRNPLHCNQEETVRRHQKPHLHTNEIQNPEPHIMNIKFSDYRHEDGYR